MEGIMRLQDKISAKTIGLPRGAKAVADQLLAGAKTTADNAFKVALVQRTLASVLAEAKKG
jgi:xanthine dehydrogenase YagS FAD-binding subunit